MWGTRSSPPPRRWAQITGNRDNDDGPLGPYYSIGFTEVGGVFYATQQRDWNWSTNGPFSGLAGIAYSRDHGETWHSVRKPFGAPLGNLTFIDGGGPGGMYPDGYVYAIGSEREFNASGLLLGRVRPGRANLTDPARWQWFAGSRAGSHGRSPAVVTLPGLCVCGAHLELAYHLSADDLRPAASPVSADVHVLLLLAAARRVEGRRRARDPRGPTPSGPFSFVARSSEFGPSNGYGAGFPSQWISRDGRDLWLKWAANFAGCAKGLDCSGKYGFNVARVHLTLAQGVKTRRHVRTLTRLLEALPGESLPLLLASAAGLGIVLAGRRALRSTARHD